MMEHTGSCAPIPPELDPARPDSQAIAHTYTASERVQWGVATGEERLEYVREHIDERHHYSRMMVAQIIVSQWFEWTLGFMVLSQLVLAAAETDYSAVDEKLPRWCSILHYIFVCGYVLELALRIYVWRYKYFQNNGNLFDLTVVAVDLGAIVGEGIFGDEIPSVTFLRSLRMIKLARTARVLKQFRELYIIAYSLAGVLKSIFWESVVLFLVFTIASIVSVEYIHPINKQLAAEGKYENCDRCPRAFESVMQSNLTFFQGMVAGDNWGLVIVPIIEKQPLTGVFFVFITLLVVLGLMNLILSAIVDKASEVRHIVEATSLLEKRAVIENAKLRLVSVCEELDEDGNGSFTMDELVHVIQTPTFQEALKIMELGPDDIDTIFGLMDADGSGAISYQELADSLQRMKSQDDHMLLLLIQRTLKQCYKKLSSQFETLAAQRQLLQEIGQFEQEVAHTLDQVTATMGTSPHFRLHHNHHGVGNRTGERSDSVGNADQVSAVKSEPHLRLHFGNVGNDQNDNISVRGTQSRSPVRDETPNPSMREATPYSRVVRTVGNEPQLRFRFGNVGNDSDDDISVRGTTPYSSMRDATPHTSMREATPCSRDANSEDIYPSVPEERRAHVPRLTLWTEPQHGGIEQQSCNGDNEFVSI